MHRLCCFLDLGTAYVRTSLLRCFSGLFAQITGEGIDGGQVFGCTMEGTDALVKFGRDDGLSRQALQVGSSAVSVHREGVGLKTLSARL